MDCLHMRVLTPSATPRCCLWIPSSAKTAGWAGLKTSQVIHRQHRELRQPIQRRTASAQAIPVQGPGSAGGTYDAGDLPQQAGLITSELIQSMKAKIGSALETDKVEVQDAYGDGRHVSIDVVSPVFEGLSSVKRQRLVYKAIWEELQSTVHAVDAMTAKTPAEAGLS